MLGGLFRGGNSKPTAKKDDSAIQEKNLSEGLGFGRGDNDDGDDMEDMQPQGTRRQTKRLSLHDMMEINSEIINESQRHLKAAPASRTTVSSIDSVDNMESSSDPFGEAFDDWEEDDDCISAASSNGTLPPPIHVKDPFASDSDDEQDQEAESLSNGDAAPLPLAQALKRPLVKDTGGDEDRKETRHRSETTTSHLTELQNYDDDDLLEENQNAQNLEIDESLSLSENVGRFGDNGKKENFINNDDFSLTSDSEQDVDSQYQPSDSESESSIHFNDGESSTPSCNDASEKQHQCEHDDRQCRQQLASSDGDEHGTNSNSGLNGERSESHQMPVGGRSENNNTSSIAFGTNSASENRDQEKRYAVADYARNKLPDIVQRYGSEETETVFKLSKSHGCSNHAKEGTGELLDVPVDVEPIAPVEEEIVFEPDTRSLEYDNDKSWSSSGTSSENQTCECNDTLHEGAHTLEPTLESIRNAKNESEEEEIVFESELGNLEYVDYNNLISKDGLMASLSFEATESEGKLVKSDDDLLQDNSTFGSANDRTYNSEDEIGEKRELEQGESEEEEIVFGPDTGSSERIKNHRHNLEGDLVARVTKNQMQSEGVTMPSELSHQASYSTFGSTGTDTHKVVGNVREREQETGQHVVYEPTIRSLNNFSGTSDGPENSLATKAQFSPANGEDILQREASDSTSSRTIDRTESKPHKSDSANGDVVLQGEVSDCTYSQNKDRNGSKFHQGSADVKTEKTLEPGSRDVELVFELSLVEDIEKARKQKEKDLTEKSRSGMFSIFSKEKSDDSSDDQSGHSSGMFGWLIGDKAREKDDSDTRNAEIEHSQEFPQDPLSSNSTLKSAEHVKEAMSSTYRRFEPDATERNHILTPGLLPFKENKPHSAEKYQMAVSLHLDSQETDKAGSFSNERSASAVQSESSSLSQSENILQDHKKFDEKVTLTNSDLQIEEGSSVVTGQIRHIKNLGAGNDGTIVPQELEASHGSSTAQEPENVASSSLADQLRDFGFGDLLDNTLSGLNSTNVQREGKAGSVSSNDILMGLEYGSQLEKRAGDTDNPSTARSKVTGSEDSSNSDVSSIRDDEEVTTVAIEQQLPAVATGSEPDSSSEYESDSSGSESVEETDQHRLGPKEAPLLRLENVTTQTRIAIPQDKIAAAKQKKSGWGWFGLRSGTVTKSPNPSALPQQSLPVSSSKSNTTSLPVAENEKQTINSSPPSPTVTVPQDRLKYEDTKDEDAFRMLRSVDSLHQSSSSPKQSSAGVSAASSISGNTVASTTEEVHRQNPVPLPDKEGVAHSKINEEHPLKGAQHSEFDRVDPGLDIHSGIKASDSFEPLNDKKAKTSRVQLKDAMSVASSSVSMASGDCASVVSGLSGTSNVRTKRKKKKKKGLGDVLGKVRKVGRHGDEISVGTVSHPRINSMQDDAKHVLLANAPDIFTPDVLDGMKPWEIIKEKKKKKEETNGSTTEQGSSTFDLFSSHFEFVAVKDETNGEVPGNVPKPVGSAQSDQSNSLCEAADRVTVSNDGTGSGVGNTPLSREDETETERSQVAEDKAALEDLYAMTQLEVNESRMQKETSELNFNSMWDEVSIDAATALDYEKSKREKQREKERRRITKEKEKDEKNAQRLRLFQKSNGRSKSAKLSSEFVRAIRILFDEDDVFTSSDEDEKNSKNTRVSRLGDKINRSGLSRQGSVKSLFLIGEDSVAGNDEESESENESSDSSSSDDSAFESSESDSENDAILMMKHGRSRRKNAKRTGSTNTKDPAEVFEKETRRIQQSQTLNVATLRQEMLDRRGTSINLIHKEYLAFKKKQRDEAGKYKRASNEMADSYRADGFGYSQQGKGSFQGAMTGGAVKQLLQDEDIIEERGLAAHLSRWNQNDAATEFDDLETVLNPEVRSPTPGGFTPGGFTAMAKDISLNVIRLPENVLDMAQRPIYKMSNFNVPPPEATSIVQPRSTTKKSTKRIPSAGELPAALPSLADLNGPNFPSAPSDMPMSTINESDDYDEANIGLFGNSKTMMNDEDSNLGSKKKKGGFFSKLKFKRTPNASKEKQLLGDERGLLS